MLAKPFTADSEGDWDKKDDVQEKLPNGCFWCFHWNTCRLLVEDIHVLADVKDRVDAGINSVY